MKLKCYQIWTKLFKVKILIAIPGATDKKITQKYIEKEIRELKWYTRKISNTKKSVVEEFEEQKTIRFSEK